MKNIYAPVISSAYDWGFDNQQVTDDLQVALAQSFKVAVVPALCNEPYMYCYHSLPKNLALDKFDLVILSDIEYYSVDKISAWINRQGIKDFLLAVGGLYWQEKLDADRMVYRPWWAYNCLKFNQWQSTDHDDKPFEFEMLLGARRPHRDFAMLSFQRSGLLDSSLVTYRSVFQGHTIDHCSQRIADYFAPLTLAYPYVSPNLHDSWEVDNNINHQISPFIPWKIYGRTRYSILCETLGMGDAFFMSEKAAKVLYGKRLFVAFASQGYLQGLKQLGFETFGSVIDESYDLEPDFLKRYQLVFEQIENLHTMDHMQVLDQVRPVLEHNHQHLINLQKTTRQQMSRLIQNHF